MSDLINRKAEIDAICDNTEELQSAQDKCESCYYIKLGRPSCSWCARNYPDRYSRGMNDE